MSTTEEGRDTLFYDGQCALCRAEMHKLAAQKRLDLDLVDLHDIEGTDNKPSKTAMLQMLHLQTKDGLWLLGLDANIDAWRGTKWFSLWRLLKLPGIYSVAKITYSYWAQKRFSAIKKRRQLEKKDHNRYEKPGY